MGVNSLLKTVTQQRRDCDLNQGPYASESSTLTTRLRRNYLSVSPRAYLYGTTRPSFAIFSMRVTCLCCSVLVWRRCNMCTSGLLRDVVFEW